MVLLDALQNHSWNTLFPYLTPPAAMEATCEIKRTHTVQEQNALHVYSDFPPQHRITSFLYICV